MHKDDLPQNDILTLHVEDAEDCMVIYMVGECDIHTAPLLMEELTGAIQTGKNIILDVHLLTYMDSTGISAIASMRESLLEKKAELRVAGAHGIFSKVVKLTRLDHIVDFYDTIEDARDKTNRRILTTPPPS